MAEIVNLRLARKRKQRADEQALAAANRLTHGRTKAEKRATDAAHAAGERHLDRHRLDPPPDRK